MIRVLIVPADGATPLLDTRIPPNLESIRAAIGGGWIEGVGSTIDGDWHAYCDEEGKIKRLPLNERATRIAHVLGWPHGDVLVGTVIFMGNGPHGTEADVPKGVLELALSLYRNTHTTVAESCPRCGAWMYRPFRALSRTDNTTYVCPPCGTAEAIEDMNGELTSRDDWPVDSATRRP
jgi:predicted RNA-binding Zn-ribbon protein involved in translation (DUF1610 family)